MLASIKHTIHQQNDTTFEEYFNEHLIETQDNNLVQEIQSTISKHRLSTLDIEKLTQSQHERLVELL